MLLSPEDGVIYSGTRTYTVNKPVEVVVFHDYDTKAKPDGDHRDVLTGMINGTSYAISVMQFSNDVKATTSRPCPLRAAGSRSIR